MSIFWIDIHSENVTISRNIFLSSTKTVTSHTTRTISQRPSRTEQSLDQRRTGGAQSPQRLTGRRGHAFSQPHVRAPPAQLLYRRQGRDRRSSGTEEEPDVHQLGPESRPDPSVSRRVSSRSCRPAGDAGRNVRVVPVTRVRMSPTVVSRL